MEPTQIYSQLLRWPKMEPALQRRIYEYGVAEADAQLLEELCEYEDLGDAIDTELREIRTIPVRAAWCRRSGRTDLEVTELVEGEKRVGALRAICESVRLGPRAAGKMAEVAVKRRSESLVISLLSHQQPVGDYLRELVLMAAKGKHAYATLTKRQNGVFLTEDHPELMDMVLANTADIKLVEFLLPEMGSLSEEAQHNLAGRILAGLLERGEWQIAAELCLGLGTIGNLSEWSRSALVPVLEELGRRVVTEPAAFWRNFAARLAAPEEYRIRHTNRADVARVTTVVELQRELFDEAVEEDDAEVLTALLLNPDLDKMILVKAVDRVHWEVLEQAVERCSDPKRITEMIEQIGDCTLLATHAKRDEFVAGLLAKQLNKEWDPNDDWMVSDAVAAGWLTKEQLLRVPLGAVGVRFSAQIGELFGEKLTEIAADERRWDLFETLLRDGNDLSLGQLLEAVVAVGGVA